MNFGLKRGHFLGEGIGHARERVAVDLDAVALHLGQYGREGTFEGLVDRCHLFLVQLRFEKLPEAQGNVGVFCGVFDRVFERHLVEGDRGFAGAEKGFDRDRRMAEIPFRERVHAMTVQARVERVAQQHGVVDRADGDAVAGENLGVVFCVLKNLEDCGALQHRLERVNHLVEGQLALGEIVTSEEIVGVAFLVAHGDIAGLARFHTKANADEIGHHFVKAGGLGVDGDIAAGMGFGDPCVERGAVLDPFIGVGVEGFGLGRIGGASLVGSSGHGFGDCGGLNTKLIGDTF